MKTGALEQAILTWKNDKHKWGWGLIFSRVVLGFLYDNIDCAKLFDSIIPSPNFHQSGQVTPEDHTAYVIDQAAQQDTMGLPFRLNPSLIIKRQNTRRMRETASLSDREIIAAQEIRPAIYVPRPHAVSGQRILVYDDVFTTGHTLNETARALRQAGAVEVCQVTLARQPWSSR